MAFRVLQVQFLKLVRGIEPGNVDDEEVKRITEAAPDAADDTRTAKMGG